MTLKNIRASIFTGSFLYNKKVAFLLWFGLSLISALQCVLNEKINNFEIFRHVFIHVREHANLYLEYPMQYQDVNLYGPTFSLLIAPFALLPVKIGAFLWILFNASFLFFAIHQLQIQIKWRTALTVLCSHEMMYVSGWSQVNPFIAGCIILGFSYIQKEKEHRALFFIMLATFIKIYGIVGLAFFFFSKRPFKFILWAIVWSVALFFAPLLLTDLSFLIRSYHDWYEALQRKSAKNISLNIENRYQDISVMGMIRRIFYPSLNDAFVLVSGMVLFAAQYLRYRYFNDVRLRLYLLCSTLIFTVIFSTGAEGPTYIIALPGMCLWYLLQPKTKMLTVFFIIMFVITTFGYSDILTPWFRSHVMMPYSLKALPCFIVWLIIIYQVLTKQFTKALDPIVAEQGPER